MLLYTNPNWVWAKTDKGVCPTFRIRISCLQICRHMKQCMAVTMVKVPCPSDQCSLCYLIPTPAGYGPKLVKGVLPTFGIRIPCLEICTPIKCTMVVTMLKVPCPSNVCLTLVPTDSPCTHTPLHPLGMGVAWQPGSRITCNKVVAPCFKVLGTRLSG